jgi:hypothetical protein
MSFDIKFLRFVPCLADHPAITGHTIFVQVTKIFPTTILAYCEIMKHNFVFWTIGFCAKGLSFVIEINYFTGPES